MGLRRFTLYHRVYAHDATPGETGGKIVPLGGLDAGPTIPEGTLQALDWLLESITPEAETPAFAVQRYPIPQSIGSYACLIVCHPFHRDGLERPAAVTHARLLRVESGDAWLDIDALIGLAAGFPSSVLQGSLDAQGDFARFLDEEESSVEVAGWNVASLENVPRPFAGYVVSACLSRLKKDGAVFPVAPMAPFDLLQDIVAAWSILPLSVRLNCAFSLNAQRGARVNALFSTVAEGGDGKIAETMNQWAAEYVDWVYDRDDARQLIENREIRDLKTLDNQFQALKATGTRDAVEVMPHRGEGAMSRQKQPGTERNIRRGGLDEELVIAINTQVKAAEESLRDYIDKRLGASETITHRARAAANESALPVRVQPRPRRRWRTIAGAIGVLAIVGAAGYLVADWRDRNARLTALEKSVADLTPTTTTTTTTATTTAAHKPATATTTAHKPLTPATELPGTSPALKFLGLSETDPKRLGVIANAIIGTDQTRSMPKAVSSGIGKISKQLAAGTVLGKDDRVHLRAVLLQCIADRAATQDDPSFSIDGQFASVPKVLLDRVTSDLHVTSKPGTDDETAIFEAEAILLWAQRKGL